MEDYKMIQNQKQIIEELKEQIEELQEEILQQILNKVDEKKKYKKIIKQQDTWLSEQHKQIEHMNNSSKSLTRDNTKRISDAVMVSMIKAVL